MATISHQVNIFSGDGLRYSEGKPRYDLIPPEFLEALADHYRKGADKYTIDLGTNPSREELDKFHKQGRTVRKINGRYKVLGDDNWKMGMRWSECYRALLSHAIKWAKGEDYDEETGTHHMIAVAWNAAALFYYQLKNIGEDNRSK